MAHKDGRLADQIGLHYYYYYFYCYFYHYSNLATLALISTYLRSLAGIAKHTDTHCTLHVGRKGANKARRQAHRCPKSRQCIMSLDLIAP